MGTMAPIAACIAVTLIASEAASIEESESLPGGNQSQRIAAKYPKSESKIFYSIF
jgi:hypothetical protein